MRKIATRHGKHTYGSSTGVAGNTNSVGVKNVYHPKGIKARPESRGQTLRTGEKGLDASHQKRGRKWPAHTDNEGGQGTGVHRHFSQRTRTVTPYRLTPLLARRPTQVVRLEARRRGPPGEEDCDPNKTGIPYSRTTGVTGSRDILGTTPENGTPSTQEGVPRGSEVSVVSVPELGPKIVTPTRQAYHTAAQPGSQGDEPSYVLPLKMAHLPHRKAYPGAVRSQMSRSRNWARTKGKKNPASPPVWEAGKIFHLMRQCLDTCIIWKGDRTSCLDCPGCIHH